MGINLFPLFICISVSAFIFCIPSSTFLPCSQTMRAFTAIASPDKDHGRRAPPVSDSCGSAHKTRHLGTSPSGQTCHHRFPWHARLQETHDGTTHMPRVSATSRCRRKRQKQQSRWQNWRAYAGPKRRRKKNLIKLQWVGLLRDNHAMLEATHAMDSPSLS